MGATHYLHQAHLLVHGLSTYPRPVQPISTPTREPIDLAWITELTWRTPESLPKISSPTPDLISHGPVTALAFLPHSRQLCVVVLHVVADTHILLPGMLPMQSASILLKRSFPGNRHGKRQSIERRIVEAFADEAAYGKNHQKGGPLQVGKLCENSRVLLFRQPAFLRTRPERSRPFPRAPNVGVPARENGGSSSICPPRYFSCQTPAFTSRCTRALRRA